MEPLSLSEWVPSWSRRTRGPVLVSRTGTWPASWVLLRVVGETKLRLLKKPKVIDVEPKPPRIIEIKPRIRVRQATGYS